MQTSESITNLVGALSSVRASGYKKNAYNSFHKSKYVELDTILEALRHPMEEAGLALTFWPDEVAGGPGLSYRLFHVPSCEWMGASVPYPSLELKGTTPIQVMGQHESYLRRYIMFGVFNLPGERDNDGNAPTEKATKGSGKDAAARPAGWRGALAECKNTYDIARLFKGVSAGMDKNSDEYAQLVNDCADRKDELS